jgi:manganese/zinc/iron transport system permease protein
LAKNSFKNCVGSGFKKQYDFNRKDIVTLTDKGQKFTERALEFIITNKTSEIELMKEDFFLFRG